MRYLVNVFVDKDCLQREVDADKPWIPGEPVEIEGLYMIITEVQQLDNVLGIATVHFRAELTDIKDLLLRAGFSPI